MPKRRASFWIKYLTIATVASLVIMEVAVRMLGYSPWNPDTRVNIQIEPGSQLFQKDSLLGYRHIAGSYHVTLPTGLEFDLTNDEATNRITRPTDSYLEDAPRPEVWIFGGSFVEGWSIEDYETFPWLLQERFSSVDIINFGVGGYGTVQTLLKLDQLLGEGRRPALVVVAYSALHDERNTLLRSRIKEVAAWNHLGEMGQPVARIAEDDSLSLRYEEIQYRTVPFVKYSALAHCVDLAINKIERRFVDSHAVTRKIIEKISQRGTENNFPVLLAHIYTGPESESLMEWARNQGLQTVDISVDLQVEGMSNRPFDAHPSAKANEIYAQVLGDFIAETGFMK